MAKLDPELQFDPSGGGNGEPYNDTGAAQADYYEIIPGRVCPGSGALIGYRGVLQADFLGSTFSLIDDGCAMMDPPRTLLGSELEMSFWGGYVGFASRIFRYYATSAGATVNQDGFTEAWCRRLNQQDGTGEEVIVRALPGGSFQGTIHVLELEADPGSTVRSPPRLKRVLPFEVTRSQTNSSLRYERTGFSLAIDLGSGDPKYQASWQAVVSGKTYDQTLSCRVQRTGGLWDLAGNLNHARSQI